MYLFCVHAQNRRDIAFSGIPVDLCNTVLFFFFSSFQRKLKEIFRDVHETYDNIDGRLKAEQFKVNGYEMAKPLLAEVSGGSSVTQAQWAVGFIQAGHLLHRPSGQGPHTGRSSVRPIEQGASYKLIPGKSNVSLA